MKLGSALTLKRNGRPRGPGASSPKIGLPATSSKKEESDFIYLLSIAIIPDFQGRGIGREIMLGFQRMAEELGQPLRLSVFRTNPRALSFYLNLGFRVAEETPEFHRLEWLPETKDED